MCPRCRCHVRCHGRTWWNERERRDGRKQIVFPFSLCQRFLKLRSNPGTKKIISGLYLQNLFKKCILSHLTAQCSLQLCALCNYHIELCRLKCFVYIMHSFTSFHMSWSREKGRLCLLVSSLRVYTGSLTSQDYLWLNTFITGLRLMLSVFVAVSFPHMSDVKDKHALWTQRWFHTHLGLLVPLGLWNHSSSFESEATPTFTM